MQNNFQFTLNNYHLQIIACTRAGEEGLAGGREERGNGGREVEQRRSRLGFQGGVGETGRLPAFGTVEGLSPVPFEEKHTA